MWRKSCYCLCNITRRNHEFLFFSLQSGHYIHQTRFGAAQERFALAVSFPNRALHCDPSRIDGYYSEVECTGCIVSTVIWIRGQLTCFPTSMTSRPRAICCPPIFRQTSNVEPTLFLEWATDRSVVSPLACTVWSDRQTRYDTGTQESSLISRIHVYKLGSRTRRTEWVCR